MVITMKQIASGSIFEQVKWERDIALEQLRSIGAELGMVMDDYERVVRCKNCPLADKIIDRFGNRYYRCVTGRYHDADWFCADGAKQGGNRNELCK